VNAATPAEKAALEAEGIALARERRVALAELISSNPEHALELAVPVGLRRALPRSIVELLEEVSGKKAIVDRQASQPGDVEITYADVSKAKRLLGYVPSTPVREGLTEFIWGFVVVYGFF
jgi:nucleoside-diphosphate-sugar epimerase